MPVKKNTGREPDGAKPDERAPSAVLTVRWSVVALAMGILALGALGTLTAIVSIKDVDTLSTVALALAVVSFAAQLIVTMAQAHQSAQVNGETRAALGEMRANTDSLLSNQTDQYDMLLRALVGKAPAVVEDAVADVEAVVQESGADAAADEGMSDSTRSQRVSLLEDALQTRLTAAIAESIAASAADPTSRALADYLTRSKRQHLSAIQDNDEITTRRDRERRARANHRNEWNALMAKYPSREEGEPVAEKLRSLSPRAIRMLSGQIASAARMAAELGTMTALAPEVDPTDISNVAALRQLSDAGFIDISPLNTSEFRMTPRGLIALRILNAEGERPTWAHSLG